MILRRISAAEAGLLDIWTMLIGLVFGSIGLGYFIYGRKQSNFVVKYSGLALMFYPWFFDNRLLLVGVGLALLALPKLIDI